MFVFTCHSPSPSPSHSTSLQMCGYMSVAVMCVYMWIRPRPLRLGAEAKAWEHTTTLIYYFCLHSIWEARKEQKRKKRRNKKKNKRHFDLVARDALSMNTGESCATWDGSLVFHFADAGTARQLQHSRSTIASIHLLHINVIQSVRCCIYSK